MVARYRGSALGLFWSVLTPLLMLAIYTFVFTEIFRMRWGEAAGSRDFALMLFAGMLVFAFVSEVVSRAPSMVVGNPNLVKKIVFPLEIQAWVVVASGMFQLAVNFLVLMAAFMLVKGLPYWTVLWLPTLLAPLCLLGLGSVWLLSSLGVFVRDISQIVGLVITATMFLSPLFYPVTAIPEQYRIFFYLNPLTFLIEQARLILVLGSPPDWPRMALFTVAMLAFAWMGFWFFQRTRRGFADVL